ARSPVLANEPPRSTRRSPVPAPQTAPVAAHSYGLRRIDVLCCAQSMAAAPPMTSIRNRAADERARTQHFEVLLARTERLRVRGLSCAELRELGELYRYHTARLAAQRDRAEDRDAIRALNALCVRAYTILYGRARRGARRDWVSALRAALGKTWRAQLLAW